jgi:hypothetical protein
LLRPRSGTIPSDFEATKTVTLTVRKKAFLFTTPPAGLCVKRALKESRIERRIAEEIVS